MKKNIALILINILICYILFFRINQLFYYTLIIPFLLTLINTDNTFQKYYSIILLPMFYFNIVNASIILISYISLYIVFKKCSIKYLYITSYILSASISLIFKFYYDSSFFILAPILSLTITIYQLKFKNTPNELLIFTLISQMIIVDNIYFILITLLILFLYTIYNKTDYLFLISFLIMCYQFYISNNYIVLIYPLIIYLSIKKEILFGVIIFLLLIIYSLYIKDITVETIFSSLILLIIVLIKEKKINSDYFPMLLESFNNEILSFCSFLDNFTTRSNNKNFNYIFDTISKSYCGSCLNRYHCFGKSKVNTYSFFKSVIKQEPSNFICSKKSEITNKVFYLLKSYPVIFESKNEIEVNKLSQALREYSVNLASKNVDIFTYYTTLKQELINYGFIPIIFEPSCSDDIEVRIGFEKRFDNIAPKLLNIANKIIKEELSVKLVSNNTLYAYYIITNKVKYNVIYDTLSVAKSNFIISGDNIFTTKFDNGYFKAAISDGMGSGFDAFELSNNTINLVEKISSQNINDNTSINILNTFYSLNDCCDIYSTLDYISIDLKSGNTTLYKMGATTTFIIRESQIIPIYNHNLPFGIDELISKEELCLTNNDLVIMVSDGITEHIDDIKLMQYIQEISNEKPHNIVYNLMNKISNENDNKYKDDMSIIAIRLVEV